MGFYFLVLFFQFFFFSVRGYLPRDQGSVSAAMACELAAGLLVVGVARCARHAAQGRHHGVRARGARLIRVGRVRGIDRRGGRVVRRRGRLVPVHRRLDGSCGGVVKVDERGGALGAMLLGALGLAEGDHPVPGVVIDDLHLVARLKLVAHLDPVLVLVVPVAEVHEDPPELVALLVGLGNHIDALDEPEAELVEDRADPLLGNVLEDARDADAEDDGLGVAGRAGGGGALLLLRRRGAVRRRHFAVRVCFENGLLV